MSQNPNFLAPVNPWATTDKELHALRTAVANAETEVADARRFGAPGRETARANVALKEARQRLALAENARKLERRRAVVDGGPIARNEQQPPAAPVAVLDSWRNAAGELVQVTSAGMRVIRA